MKEIVSISTSAQISGIGWLAQLDLTGVHQFASFIPPEIVVVEPGAEHVGVVVPVEFARRQR
jgi:hypothetical protein